MPTQNIYHNIPPDSSDEIFEPLESAEHIKIERIVSRGQQSPDSGWYDQDDNEWVLLLKGKASIEFEDGAVTHLGEGDYLNIKAHEKHRVLAADTATETVWLAIHYK